MMDHCARDTSSVPRKLNSVNVVEPYRAAWPAVATRSRDHVRTLRRTEAL